MKVRGSLVTLSFTFPIRPRIKKTEKENEGATGSLGECHRQTSSCCMLPVTVCIFNFRSKPGTSKVPAHPLPLALFITPLPLPAPHPSQMRPAAPWLLQSRSFFIQTEPTPNPNSLKFLPGRQVLPPDHGTGAYFTPGDAGNSQSPLASCLLSLEGVTGVFLGADFITISKNEEGGWALMKPVVFGAIMDFFSEGKAVMLDEPVVTDTTILDDDDEVVAMIKELLQERVRPAVQEDGGDIFYKGFDPNTGVVEVRLAGSCSGCPSSTVTLKHGVENMLMHYIPEVTAVNAVEDEELIAVNQKEVNQLEDRLKAAGVPFEP